jgi:Skp family chaperone for outer membrane proteins
VKNNFIPLQIIKITDSMANEQLIINGIEHKIRIIIESNVQLKKENSNLKQEIERRDKELVLLKRELEIKKSELVKITLANTLEKEFGKEESNKKLEDLIAEIDRCIEVLTE